MIEALPIGSAFIGPETSKYFPDDPIVNILHIAPSAADTKLLQELTKLTKIFNMTQLQT